MRARRDVTCLFLIGLPCVTSHPTWATDDANKAFCFTHTDAQFVLRVEPTQGAGPVVSTPPPLCQRSTLGPGGWGALMRAGWLHAAGRDPHLR
jgi:hypothetical protein